jgi:hypothetical protein
VSYGAEILQLYITAEFEWTKNADAVDTINHLTGIFTLPVRASPLNFYQWSWTYQHIFYLVPVT